MKQHNLLGQVNASSPISPTELYFMWCMKEQRKVHLGYWLAHTCQMITVRPECNLTICHILGEFLIMNLNILFEGIAPPSLCPPPDLFDILYFVKVKLIRMVEGHYCFYDVGQSEGPSSPHKATLAIMDKPTEEGNARRENNPKRKMTASTAHRGTEGSSRKRMEREGPSTGKEIGKEVPREENESAAWMRRMDEMMGQLVESSRAHQATMVVQTAQLTKAVSSLEVSLELINDRLPPPRRQEIPREKTVAREATHYSDTPLVFKRSRHNASPPIRSNIRPPHQWQRTHQSTSSSHQQLSPRFPPK